MNDGGDSLEEHLLPGLSPIGVPKNLKNSVHPFKYNDFDALEKIVNQEDIGVIKMEVYRNIEPTNNFLEKVRNLADKKNIVLIFDECTSGFRETFGGLHKKYNVEPDMAMFGKALGNGHAITSVIGKRSIMDAAQSTFISSTFWTERIGPTAALKTLEVMQEINSWETITNTGKLIRNGIQEIANSYNLKINSWGLDALTGYTFDSDRANFYKTFVTQEMLKKGFLTSNSVYVCTKHNREIIDSFLNALDPIFKGIKECEDGKDIEKLLESPVCHSGFARLN
jgi:glutamate-1-semialdehyde 2,1-aminomutase